MGSSCICALSQHTRKQADKAAHVRMRQHAREQLVKKRFKHCFNHFAIPDQLTGPFDFICALAANKHSGG
jgi:hypothetical protein